MSEQRLKYPLWQEAYLSAILEMNPARMKLKLSAARAAIQTRLMDTRHTPDPLEQQAITDALNSLSALKRSAA
jgi:hypothetical protein